MNRNCFEQIINAVQKWKLQIFRKKLNNIDWNPLVKQLAYRKRWNRKQAMQAIAQYIGFLCLLYLYPNLRCVPTQTVDEVWHIHICQTRKYRQDCQVLFQRYLDHDPCMDLSAEEQAQLQADFDRTQKLLEKHFGKAIAGADPENEGDKPSACGHPQA
jgi:hypothetical protein